MRKDMKRVIIEVVRFEDRGTTSRGSGVRSRERILVARDPEALPERLGTCRRLWGGTRSPSDRLGPLWRWLRRQVGRPWDNVWSEVCSTNDERTIDGWHLRRHLSGWVRPHRQRPRGQFYGAVYFVDRHGILRCDSDYRSNSWLSTRSRSPLVGDPDRIVVSQRLRYERIEGFWYAVEKDERNEIPVWDAAQRQRVLMVLGPDDLRRWRKRRLGNREVRTLALDGRARGERPHASLARA